MYRGIILSVTASCLFAAQYYLAALVPDMSEGEVFGWRTMIVFPFVTVFLVSSGEWNAVSEIVDRIKNKPLLLHGLILSSMLMIVQQWLFIWAPERSRTERFPGLFSFSSGYADRRLSALWRAPLRGEKAGRAVSSCRRRP